MTRAPRYVALLRGINVTGRNKIPMAELRTVCGELGWRDVATYIQSGNAIFSATGAAKKLEADLEKAIEKHFSLTIPVIVRSAAEWPSYVKGNPFPDASVKEGNLVMLCLSKLPPHKDAVDKLRERAANGEVVERVGDALWIHFAAGVGRSKLSPAFFDRVAGSPVTARNWRTVLKLAEMLS
jgi:uncharacterized protein (DUF1697 family)